MGRLYTIGYGGAKPERFLDALQVAGVQVVCDVRSLPVSNRFPEYNKHELTSLLRNVGIKYLFMGKELGARPSDASVYANGRVQYDRLSETEYFRHGIMRILRGIESHVISLLCAEKDPIECHRAILVARYLASHGVEAQHIHVPFHVEPHTALETRLLAKFGLNAPSMFESLGTTESRKHLLDGAYARQEQIIAYKPQKVSAR